MDVFKEELQ